MLHVRYGGYLAFCWLFALGVFASEVRADDGAAVVTPAVEAPPLAYADPVTPDALPETRALLKLLYDISGKYTLTGQHNSQKSKDRYSLLARDIYKKYPAVYSKDFAFGGEDKESLQSTRRDIVKECIRQHKMGAIITLSWHAVPPTTDEPVVFRAEEPAGGELASIIGRLTPQQFNDVLTPGTKLHTKWRDQVDTISAYLKQLEEARVPVFWRPYHEMNGSWFWWGGVTDKQRGTAALYRQIFDRMVNYHKLKNLLWVWNVDRPTSEHRKYEHYYPGNEYLDVLSLDVYGDFEQYFYDDLLRLTQGKPMVFGEVGSPPSMEILTAQPRWAYWVAWSGFLGRRHDRVGHGCVVEHDELVELVKDPRMVSLTDPVYCEVTAEFRAACGLPKLEPGNLLPEEVSTSETSARE